MQTYRSYRIIDGKPKWIITDEKGYIINKQPGKEELKSSKYSKEIRPEEQKICDRCGTDLWKGGNPRKEYREGKWTGRWLCNKCSCKDRYEDVEKSISGRRTGLISQKCPSGKGDIFEQITCDTRGLNNLNYENDNFNSPIDHSRDPEYGILQTKGASLRNYLGRQVWGFCTRGEVERYIREDDKKFDNMILYCMDKEMKNVLRVYIIPYEEVILRTKININVNSSKYSWYEKYRVDEKPYNGAYHRILLKKKNTMVGSLILHLFV